MKWFIIGFKEFYSTGIDDDSTQLAAFLIAIYMIINVRLHVLGIDLFMVFDNCNVFQILGILIVICISIIFICVPIVAWLRFRKFKNDIPWIKDTFFTEIYERLELQEEFVGNFNKKDFYDNTYLKRIYAKNYCKSFEESVKDDFFIYANGVITKKSIEDCFEYAHDKRDKRYDNSIKDWFMKKINHIAIEHFKRFKREDLEFIYNYIIYENWVVVKAKLMEIYKEEYKCGFERDGIGKLRIKEN